MCCTLIRQHEGQPPPLLLRGIEPTTQIVEHRALFRNQRILGDDQCCRRGRIASVCTCCSDLAVAMSAATRREDTVQFRGVDQPGAGCRIPGCRQSPGTDRGQQCRSAAAGFSGSPGERIDRHGGPLRASVRRHAGRQVSMPCRYMPGAPARGDSLDDRRSDSLDAILAFQSVLSVPISARIQWAFAAVRWATSLDSKTLLVSIRISDSASCLGVHSGSARSPC